MTVCCKHFKGEYISPRLRILVQVWFEPSSYTVNEDAGTVTLTVRTNLAGGPPPGSVRFTTTDGSAICKYKYLHCRVGLIHCLSLSALSDYIATSSDVSFEAGAFVTTITVPIVDDSVGELEEVFYGSLTNLGQSNVQIIQGTADIHILDDDGQKNHTRVNNSLICSLHL